MLLRWFVFFPIFVALTAAFVDNFARRDSPPLTTNASADLDSYDIAGKTVLVTGGSNGVGFAAAKKISERGGKVIVTGRSKSTVENAVQNLPEGAEGLKLDFIAADDDPASIKSFVSALSGLLGQQGKLDVILWNAGTAYRPDATPYDVEINERSVDFLVATNHLGHFALLQALLPDIKKWNTRNVFTSSISHQLGSAAYLPGPPSAPSGPGGPFLLYGETKLMNALTALKLQRIFDADPSTAATAVVATPGFCATKIMSAGDRSVHSFDPLSYLPLIKSSEQGGGVLAYAAFVPSPPAGLILLPYWVWDGASLYLDGVWRGAWYNFVQEMLMQWTSPAGHVYAHRLNPVAYDEGRQDELWSWSAEFIGTKS
mmetsp:Transcript_22557/g.45068  ORF Transcript_22557/g.45068 Transcript_22557/m.45068 type:complete len:372 (+) Transcript_22557:275-1390(+)